MPVGNRGRSSGAGSKGGSSLKKKRPNVAEHVFKGHRIKVYASAGRFSAQFVDANRKRQRFEKATERLAVEAAKAKIRELTDTGAQKLALEETRAAEILRPAGMTLIEAARLCATLVDRLKPHGGSIEGAVDYYLQTCAAKPVAVEVIVRELISVKQRDRGFQYVKDLRTRLEGRFCAAFGDRNIGEITKAELNVWLDSLDMVARSRRNFHSSLVTLFRFAQSRGYLPDDRPTAIQRAVKPKAEKPSRVIYEPEEMIALLAVARSQGTAILPTLAIAGFAGIRTEELCQSDPKKDRLRWEDISWSESGPEIRVRAEVSKTSEERFLPVTPNLQLWLTTYQGQTGPIFPDSRLDVAYAGLSRASKIKWKKNALRRSYATYRAAASASINATVKELGNSESMLKRHYNRPIPEATTKAERWFSITPSSVDQSVSAMDEASVCRT